MQQINAQTKTRSLSQGGCWTSSKKRSFCNNVFLFRGASSTNLRQLTPPRLLASPFLCTTVSTSRLFYYCIIIAIRQFAACVHRKEWLSWKHFTTLSAKWYYIFTLSHGSSLQSWRNMSCLYGWVASLLTSVVLVYSLVLFLFLLCLHEQLSTDRYRRPSVVGVWFPYIHMLQLPSYQVFYFD